MRQLFFTLLAMARSADFPAPFTLSSGSQRHCHSASISENGSTQNRVLGPAAASSPANLLELQSLGPKTGRMRICSFCFLTISYLEILKLTKAWARSSTSSELFQVDNGNVNHSLLISWKRTANTTVSVLFCQLHSLYEVNIDISISQSCYFWHSTDHSFLHTCYI